LGEAIFSAEWGGFRYPTGRRNTHGTEVRELSYPWHPWSGRLIHIHGLVDTGSAVFRCSLSGSASCRLLEVPVWMFDRTLGARWLALPIAYADLSCGLALEKLLEEARHSLARRGFKRRIDLSRSESGRGLPSKLGRLPHERYRALPATAAIGNSSSRCAASIPF
jgi:hypothetical protein